jgi:class 3 adenylate cyclase/tetratricopeptide (TPR) repeat protein
MKVDVAQGERRQITVLFADMAGYTAVSERLGEEGAYELIQPIYTIMADAVRELNGTVQDFTGDGIMALFGVPTALEDAPLRACRASLLIQQRLADAMTAMESRFGFRPQMRIGINSGPAVVGRVGAGGEARVTAIGDTVNLASRLQNLAEPGTVLLSDAANRLVQGLVATDFLGEHAVKGKSELQRVYRLNSVSEGVTRFSASMRRGLAGFVGRDQELARLESCAQDALGGKRVVDIVGEPGIGKSRLLHEFRQRIDRQRLSFLSGDCSSDGRQTAFLPFIEVVRSSFQVQAGANEAEVAGQLERGLMALALDSEENRGLLLNLLGLPAPEGALAGLDAVLIGLRTRDLLLKLLTARCRLKPVVLVLEDLHWIDSASEDLLARSGDLEERLTLLIVCSHRPEYQPRWLPGDATTIALAPLSTRATSEIVQSRLGQDTSPAALLELIAERADGNALFAEEIAGYLKERGLAGQGAPGGDFDRAAVAAVMPASIQLLLAARIDALAVPDRELLQTAAVIGRRFDPDLLAAIATKDAEQRLTGMQALDFIHRDERIGDFIFKHALVRDALYGSMLAPLRAGLHLRIAEELEARNGNRLAEVAQSLAHHYAQTTRADKAFAYSAMAAKQNLGVYSLEEAAAQCRTALSLLEQDGACANDAALADLLADFACILQLQFEISSLIGIVETWMSRVDRLGNEKHAAVMLHHYAMALLWACRYRDALVVQRKLSAMAESLQDDRAMVCAFAVRVQVEFTLAPRPAAEIEGEAQAALAAASRLDDVYPGLWLRLSLGMDAVHRGFISRADAYARELIEVGRRVDDPRALGLGLWLLSQNAMTNDDYQAGLEFGQQALQAAITPMEEFTAMNNYANSLVLLKRLQEGVPLLEKTRRRDAEKGCATFLTLTDPVWGVAQMMQGKLAEGIAFIKRAIVRREQEGYRAAADWYRTILCYVYIDVLEGREKPSLGVILRNFPCLVMLKWNGLREIDRMMDTVRANRLFDPEGFHYAKINMILGLRWMLARRTDLAKPYLDEARRLALPFGPTPLSKRVDAALARLGG